MIAITRRPSPLLESGERTHIGRAPIDFARALAQHDGYRAALVECGVEVLRLDDADGFADGVFVEDTAIVLDEIAVVTRPGAESRRPEVSGIEAVLRRYRTITRVWAPATLDGGDVVVIDKRILVGVSQRTNADGIAALAAATRTHGYSVS